MASTTTPIVAITNLDERHVLLTLTCGEVIWEHRFRTLAAAKMAANKKLAIHHDRSLKHKSLSEFAVEWQRDYLARECTQETAQDYGKCFRRLVLPRLGDVSLDKITRATVDLFTDELYREGGCWTVHRGRRTLSAMLGVAESWGYIPVNPVGRRRS
jgi:hypothetical protein